MLCSRSTLKPTRLYLNMQTLSNSWHAGRYLPPVSTIFSQTHKSQSVAYWPPLVLTGNPPGPTGCPPSRLRLRQDEWATSWSPGLLLVTVLVTGSALDPGRHCLYLDCVTSHLLPVRSLSTGGELLPGPSDVGMATHIRYLPIHMINTSSVPTFTHHL